jgi:hypothetical protein
MLSYPWLNRSQKYGLAAVSLICFFLPYFGKWGGIGWFVDAAIIIAGVIGNVVAVRRAKKENATKVAKRIAAKKATEEKVGKRESKKKALIDAYIKKMAGIDPAKKEDELLVDAKYFIAKNFGNDKILDSMDERELSKVLNGFLKT